MQPLSARIYSTILEAIVAGFVYAGALLLVRRIQLALGVKDDKEEIRKEAGRAQAQ
jgi:hypothetical protein